MLDLPSLSQTLEDDFTRLVASLDVEDEEPIDVSIERYNYIPEKQTFYSFFKTPFFRPFFALLDNPDVRVIGLMLPSQIGKSEFLKATEMELARRYSNTLVLHYCPSEKNALEYVRTKLTPSVLASSKYEKLLKKVESGNIDKTAVTKSSIRFVNGSSIEVLGVNGKDALLSKTSRFVVVDEYAAMDGAQKARGDVLSLAKTRQTSYSYGNRKVIVASTPLEPDKTIDRLHKESKQFSWTVPCPHCGEFQILTFENLKVDIPEDVKASKQYNKIANEIESGSFPVYYQCPHCQGKFTEREKLLILNQGKLECTGNADLSMNQISLHLSGLYSGEKWENLMASFFSAQTDKKKLQEFRNQKLADPWSVDRQIVKVNTEAIAHSPYPRGVIPENSYKLICGLDVQGANFYSIILSYTLDGEFIVVDWDAPLFDSNNSLDPDSYPFQLDDYGYNGTKLDSILVDTGNNSYQLTELANSLTIGQPIKGYAGRDAYDRLFKQTTQTKLLHINKNTSNDFLEDLIKSKKLLIPSNTPNDSDLLIHLSNVVKVGDVWEDREGSGGRVDLRDALRYAIVQVMYAKYGDELETARYYADKFNKSIAA